MSLVIDPAGSGDGLLDLQREIHHGAALRDAAQRDDVHLRGEIGGQGLRSHPPAGFYHLGREFSLQCLSSSVQLLLVRGGQGERKPAAAPEP